MVINKFVLYAKNRVFMFMTVLIKMYSNPMSYPNIKSLLMVNPY